MGKLRDINNFKQNFNYRLGSLSANRMNLRSCATCKYRLFQMNECEKIDRIELFCTCLALHKFEVSHSKVCDKYISQSNKF